MKLMNSRGVTTVKEMGFDDFYGFDSFLKEKEEQKELSLRTFLCRSRLVKESTLNMEKE